MSIILFIYFLLSILIVSIYSRSYSELDVKHQQDQHNYYMKQLSNSYIDYKHDIVDFLLFKHVREFNEVQRFAVCTRQEKIDFQVTLLKLYYKL